MRLMYNFYSRIFLELGDIIESAFWLIRGRRRGRGREPSRQACIESVEAYDC